MTRPSAPSIASITPRAPSPRSPREKAARPGPASTRSRISAVMACRSRRSAPTASTSARDLAGRELEPQKPMMRCLDTAISSATSPGSTGHAEHGPMRVRARQAEQSAAALLDDLIRHQDVLGAGVDVTIEALHRGVVQRCAAGGAMREGADVGDRVVDVTQRQLDHRQLVKGGLLAAIAGRGYLAPCFVHQRPRRAIARLHLGELEPEARAVARFAEWIVPRHDPFGKSSDSASFRFQFAQMEARYRAARALVHETWREVSATCDRGEQPTLDQLTMIKLSLRHIHDAISDVGTFAHRAARGASLHNTAMQRFYRDIHSGTQHILMADQIVEECGRALLGLPGPDAHWTVFGVTG